MSVFCGYHRIALTRSDEQAAYCGLTQAQAIEVGRQAKVFTANALAQPFTIYTRWRSVFGPTRYYAIVITSGGRDLNELLVRSGLARIYGTRTTLPDGRDSHEYLGNLHALENEAKAAKRHPVGYGAAVKEREIIADNLSEAGWSWGCVSSINFNGPTIWITDAHLDDGRRSSCTRIIS